MERFEELYHSTHIYRAWVLCGSDDETERVARDLDERHHTVVTIVSDDVENERMTYVDKLDAFRDTARLLVISYPAWHQIQEDIEVHVLPHQNLLAFGDLETDVCEYVKRRLADAARRGFKSTCSEAHVMYLNEEENIA